MSTPSDCHRTPSTNKGFASKAAGIVMCAWKAKIGEVASTLFYHLKYI